MLDLFESLILGPAALDSSEEKLEVVGNFNFYVEPSISGFQGYHTSTVVVTVFEDASKKKPLDFAVKWSKILSNEPYEMENYQEKHYHFTPSDIDLKVRAAISCSDPKYPGVAYLYLGPIELDKSLCPELEGMILNMKGSFKMQILARNGVALRPNTSVIRIDKPYLSINFDPVLEETALGQSDVAAYLPVEINFETDHQMKVRIDYYSTTCVLMSYKDEAERDQKLAIYFDTRDQRDVFYIFLRLLRSIKTNFLERLMNEYDIIINSPWSFLHLDLDEEEDDPEGKLSFLEILKADTIRERLREMLRMKQELSYDNQALTDSLVVMEADLIESSKRFKELLNETRSGKTIRNLAKYEKSRSALGELSLSIIGDLKRADKSTRLQKEEQGPTKEELEAQIKKTKDSNVRMRKEMETIKQGGEAFARANTSTPGVGLDYPRNQS
jgi:hypothetical protein